MLLHLEGHWVVQSIRQLKEVNAKLKSAHRGPTQSVWVADCYFIVNVLDLPFASPIVVKNQNPTVFERL